MFSAVVNTFQLYVCMTLALLDDALASRIVKCHEASF
jgi:hypothetical protein